MFRVVGLVNTPSVSSNQRRILISRHQYWILFACDSFFLFTRNAAEGSAPCWQDARGRRKKRRARPRRLIFKEMQISALFIRLTSRGLSALLPFIWRAGPREKKWWKATQYLNASRPLTSSRFIRIRYEYWKCRFMSGGVPFRDDDCRRPHCNLAAIWGKMKRPLHPQHQSARLFLTFLIKAPLRRRKARARYNKDTSQFKMYCISLCKV